MIKVLLFSTAFLLSITVYSQTEEEQMFKLLNEAIQKDPKNSEFLFLRGLAFGETKNYNEAIADFSSALQHLNTQKNKPLFGDDEPVDSIKILTTRAYCYEMINAVDLSIADYRYLQTAKPKDFMYSIAVARLYIKQKDFEKAQSEVDRLKKLSENERGLVYQSILFYEQNNYNEALAAIEIALNKYPLSVEALIIKAKILNKLDKSEDACKKITEAKMKISLDYFGGERGYLRDFEKEIDFLKNSFCK